MGNVSYRVPSIHPMLAAAPSNVVIHHPDFAKWAGSEMGDAAALDGAKALAMTTIDYLMNACAAGANANAPLRCRWDFPERRLGRLAIRSNADGTASGCSATVR